MYSVSRRLTKWKKDKEMKQKINELSILKNKGKKKKRRTFLRNFHVPEEKYLTRLLASYQVTH